MFIETVVHRQIAFRNFTCEFALGSRNVSEGQVKSFLRHLLLIPVSTLEKSTSDVFVS